MATDVLETGAAPDMADGANRFFVTGTGRCATMLLQRALALGENVECAHERSMKYSKLSPAYSSGDLSVLYEEIDEVIAPDSERALAAGRHWGEVSGLLWPVVPEMACRWEEARFALLVRRPDEFVRSAIARGFFDLSHPHGLEHVQPLKGTEMSGHWPEAEPVEKCLWYWAEVNGFVLRAFAAMEPDQCRVVRMENFSLELVEKLYGFLGISGFDAQRAALAALLRQRVNSTPEPGEEETERTQGDSGRRRRAQVGEVNPYSLPHSIPSMDRWPLRWRRAFDRWAAPLAAYLYPGVFGEGA